jgi:formiminotetrahydrofolate cyclodeaminase
MAMTTGRGAIDTQELAEAVRKACLDAAASAYEDASLSGLCQEGAWEVAVGAIRSVDLDAVGASLTESGQSEGNPRANGSLEEPTSALAKHFASPGAPAAGSAAAATGAVAAGLLEWAAALSEERGSEDLRRRAHAIRSRAAVLRSGLASAGQKDAELVRTLLGPEARGGAYQARRHATESLLEIGARCAQIVTLAAEVATHGHEAIRPDVVSALRLAGAASECALELAEENLRPEEGQEWALRAKRRAWRTRLLLQRAASLLRGNDPE